MNHILVLFAHPALRRSRVNGSLIDDIGTVEGVTVHDLYEQYPEFDIDVSREQELLLGHDVVVFQHPFYWYSTPAILKEWQDLVLEHGWAYGSAGDALEGKLFFCALTTGGMAEAYRPDGYNRFTIRQLLAPLEQTAFLCKMRYLPPFVIHGTHAISVESVAKERQEYRLLLSDLRDGVVDIDRATSLDYLNGAPRLVPEESR